MSSGSQFVRIQGYPRGPRNQAGTLDAIIDEGLRSPTHIAHLSEATNIEVMLLPQSP